MGRDVVDLGKKDADEVNEEDRDRLDLVRDRFRLSVISICESQARKNGMDIAEIVVACISDLAFNMSEQLAKDLELFSQHAGRKTVNMEDVILTAHRNEGLAAMLRTISLELKGKEPQAERKRKKTSRDEDTCILE
ncbi:Centromere protein S [Zostera marina]|uniref:Centromere protein S n=1 Tax=Zostera marina TaxID=29655 RepID=A0A0K9PFE0_ZOSMR|nr:Centromere protein S [Zostera marina]